MHFKSTVIRPISLPLLKCGTELFIYVSHPKQGDFLKAIIVSAIVLASLHASAISFITEEDVQQTLGAQKVIEISKYSVADKLLDAQSPCQALTMSKSGRAYIVKKENKSLIVVTPDGLADLQICGDI